jgi:hypothetical protein
MKFDFQLEVSEEQDITAENRVSFRDIQAILFNAKLFTTWNSGKGKYTKIYTPVLNPDDMMEAEGIKWIAKVYEDKFNIVDLKDSRIFDEKFRAKGILKLQALKLIWLNPEADRGIMRAYLRQLNVFISGRGDMPSEEDLEPAFEVLDDYEKRDIDFNTIKNTKRIELNPKLYKMSAPIRLKSIVAKIMNNYRKNTTLQSIEYLVRILIDNEMFVSYNTVKDLSIDVFEDFAFSDRTYRRALKELNIKDMIKQYNKKHVGATTDKTYQKTLLEEINAINT